MTKRVLGHLKVPH